MLKLSHKQAKDALHTIDCIRNLERSLSQVAEGLVTHEATGVSFNLPAVVIRQAIADQIAQLRAHLADIGIEYQPSSEASAIPA